MRLYGLLAICVFVMPAAADPWTVEQREADPGEIVVLRNVSSRTAYRNEPKGVPVLVDANTEDDVKDALSEGLGEIGSGDQLSEREISQISSRGEGGGTQRVPVDGAGASGSGSNRTLTRSAGVMGPGGAFSSVVGGGGRGGLVSDTVLRATGTLADTIKGSVMSSAGVGAR